MSDLGKVLRSTTSVPWSSTKMAQSRESQIGTRWRTLRRRTLCGSCRRETSNVWTLSSRLARRVRQSDLSHTYSMLSSSHNHAPLLRENPLGKVPHQPSLPGMDALRLAHAGTHAFAMNMNLLGCCRCYLDLFSSGIALRWDLTCCEHPPRGRDTPAGGDIVIPRT